MKDTDDISFVWVLQEKNVNNVVLGDILWEGLFGVKLRRFVVTVHCR